MDRPQPHRWFAAVLALSAVAPGCRSTRPEVPPARPYASDGRQRKPIDFSSQGHPVNGAATAVLQPNLSPGSRMGGMPAREARDGGSTPYGAFPGPSYGAPGTSGLGTPPTPLPAPEPMPTPASVPDPAPAPAPASPAVDPLMPSIDPPSISPTATEPAVGTMGQPGNFPSPN